MATSFKSGDKFYIGGDKLLPLEKYVAEDLCQAFAEDFPGSSPNRNHHQVWSTAVVRPWTERLIRLQEQRSLSVQVERRGVVQCAEVEEAVGVVAEGHLGAEVDLEVIEAEEEVAVEEEEEASALAAAVGVEMQTSRDLQGAFEAGVHSHVQGVTDLGMVSGYCMIGHV